MTRSTRHALTFAAIFVLAAAGWMLLRANAAMHGTRRHAEAALAEFERGEARAAAATRQDSPPTHPLKQEAPAMTDPKLAEMKDKLTPEQYNVCFLKGTEPPFSGKYYKTKDPGEYHCAACDALLFYSDTKFDSGTGWPSFWDGAVEGAIGRVEDRSHGMLRTEVTCANCGAHLGHVFDDGPKPTGQRYCINSLALEFKPNPARQPASD